MPAKHGRVLVAAWVAVGLVLGVVAGAIRASAQEDGSVKEIGRLPILWPNNVRYARGAADGSMIVSPKVRRAYQIFRVGGSRTALQAFDLDTMKPAGSAELPFLPAHPTISGTNGEFAHAVSDDGKRLYIATSIGASQWGGIAEVDAITLELRRPVQDKIKAVTDNLDVQNVTSIANDPTAYRPCTSAACIPFPPGTPNSSLRGMSFVPAVATSQSAEKLLFVTEDVNSALAERTANIFVVQWDVKTFRQDWSYRVNACSRAYNLTPDTQYQMGVFQSFNGPSIFMTCFSGGSTATVVRLDADNTSTGRPGAEVVFPGPLGFADSIADPDSDRMLIRVAATDGDSYWIFDGRTSSYVGVVGTVLQPTPNAAGLDPETGRFYVFAPPTTRPPTSSTGGLFMTDVRKANASQARLYPIPPGESTFRIAVDPAADDKPRRIFVYVNGDSSYRIVEDNVPISEDPPLADLDRLTTDVEEEDGETEVNYTGSGRAYGLRSLFLGGVEGLIPARGFLQTVPFSPCQRPDRELVAGRIIEGKIQDGLPVGISTAADTDSITRTDIQQPTARCLPRRLPANLDPIVAQYLGSPQKVGAAEVPSAIGTADTAAGTRFPFDVAACSGTGSKTQAREEAGRFVATSNCNAAAEMVTTSALGEVGSLTTESLGDPVKGTPAQGTVPTQTVALSAGTAYASTTLKRVPGLGLTVRSESWVNGIDIPGAFRIDAARSVAEARAAGRPGTAGTTLVRAVCGITIYKEAAIALPQVVVDNLPQTPEGHTIVEGCYDPFTQIKAVGQQQTVTNATSDATVRDRPLFYLLNRALGSRGRVRVPEPDVELKKGTPGGYLASLQKDRGEEIQSKAIAKDNSTEVPVLEITMFNDDAVIGRGRQVVQLAGVVASSTYGIIAQPSFDDFDDGFGGDDFGSDGETLQDLLVDMTGGFPAFPRSTSSSAALGERVAAPGNVIAAAANRVGSGISFLARSPREAALAGACWLLIGLPLYLAARRRLLVITRS